VGVHFDPVIAHDGWEERYGALVDRLFRTVPRDAIAWISIGTLRCVPHTKSAIERRFPHSSFLYGELLIDFDGKLRYPYPQRQKLYEAMLAAIRRHSKKVPVYLCMEHYRMWRALARYRLYGEKALEGA
jgi:spore photoproduct lyase